MSKSKRNKAVALKYNAKEDLAPIVIASGYGDVAKRIIEVAESRGILYSGMTAQCRFCVCWRWGAISRRNCTKQ